MTERQKIVKHFQTKKQKFVDSKEMAVALRQDQVGERHFDNEKEYVDKVLKAGYKSDMAVQLLNDINGTKSETEEKK